MFLNFCYVPGKYKATWEGVPREVAILAEVCAVKKPLNAA